MDIATDALEMLSARNRERETLIDTLRLWAEVEKQGIDPETVKSFGLDSHRLYNGMGFSEQSQWRGMQCYTGCVRDKVTGRWSPVWYNYVTLNSGERQYLSPALRKPIQ